MMKIPSSAPTQPPAPWAYDADGKPNADGFGMLAKMATSTMESFRLLESQLDEALEDGSLSGAHRRSVKALRKNIRKLARTLEPVYKQSRHIVQKLALADPAEREAVYRAFYRGRASKKLKSFKELSRDFAKLYQQSTVAMAGSTSSTKPRPGWMKSAMPCLISQRWMKPSAMSSEPGSCWKKARPATTT
ncbi:MAG: hypothetical protein LRZ85_09770 [Alphaproteobacteria bacterium]|nr:hypothetical protein [Alphaproteobacteria bacterium]